MVTNDAARIAGLDDLLGALAPGRPADLLVLERRDTDPWQNVVEADPSWVELVAIGGDLAYGRRDWLAALGSPPDIEDVIAWGKPMVLDTRYAVGAGNGAPLRLADLRSALVALYPQVGPIFA